MTLNEFKYWLDGFTDAIKDTPTPKEWAIILEKLNSALTAENKCSEADAAWERAWEKASWIKALKARANFKAD